MTLPLNSPFSALAKFTKNQVLTDPSGGASILGAWFPDGSALSASIVHVSTGIYRVDVAPSVANQSGNYSGLVVHSDATMDYLMWELEFPEIGTNDATAAEIAAIPNAPDAATIRAEMDSNSTKLSTIVSNETAIGIAIVTAQGAITDIQTDVDELQTAASFLATASALTTIGNSVTEIAADTDTLLINVATVNSSLTDVQTDVDELQTSASSLATASALTTVGNNIIEIATDTDAILANVATAQTGITEIATDTDLLLTAVGTVLSKVNTFGEQEIFIISPIVGGKITLYKGRDFNAADGQQLDIPLNIVIGSLDTIIWNGIGPLATSTPVTATGSYVDSGHCRVQLTATQCALFTLGIGTWEVVVTPHSTSRKVEAARGPLEIKSVVIP